MEEYWKAATGKKFDYFGPKFLAIENGNYGWGAWNNSALALGPIWMGNRQIPMWRVRVPVVVCTIACLFAYDFLPVPLNVTVCGILYIYTFPLHANAIYKDCIEKFVEENSHLNDLELKELLASKFKTDVEQGNKKLAAMRKPWI
ncbi:MAG: hypothetical protein V7744_20675 [Pseudomonadales bacterium]